MTVNPTTGDSSALPKTPKVDFSAPLAAPGATATATATAPAPAKAPFATTQTNPPENTFYDAKIEPEGSVMVYQPDLNRFIALTLQEWLAVRQQADEHNTAIEDLQTANSVASNKALALRALQRTKNSSVADLKKAQNELDQALNKVAEASEAAKKKLEPLASLDAGEGEKLHELFPLTLKRGPIKAASHTPIYVHSSKLKSALADNRVYLVDGAAEARKYEKDKLIKNGRLDHDELKKRMAQKIQDSTAFKGKLWKWPKGEEKEASGQLFAQWATTMGADATRFLERSAEELKNNLIPVPMQGKDNPHRNIDLKPEAQLMRWTAGAGLEANFNPFQGNLLDRRDHGTLATAKRGLKSGMVGIKANAEASLMVAEGKVPLVAYYPHYAGWHATPQILGNTYDLGYYRFLLEIDLIGSAGASLALDVDIGITYTADKQGIRGTPRGQKGIKVKAGAEGEIKAFAGIKTGIDLKGAFQWLNPEGLIELDALAKLKDKEAIAEYCDVATVDSGVAASAGVGGDYALKIEHKKGYFVITIKAGLCIGLGGEYHCTFKTETNTIKAFFKYVAYTLKHADWHKLSDFITDEAYHAYSQIWTMVIAKKQNLEDFVGMEIDEISNMYRDAMKEVKQLRDDLIMNILDALQNRGIIAYLPPESSGALMAVVQQVALATPAEDSEARERHAFIINELVACQQTPRQLEELFQHATLNIGEKVNVEASQVAMNNITTGTRFDGCIGRSQTAVAMAKPTLGKPFLWNDEHSFVAANLPLHSTEYIV